MGVGSRMKTCTKCLRSLPTTEFHKAPTNRDGLKTACRDCVNEWHRNYRATMPKEEKDRQRREHDLKWTFGITLSQYESMVEMQNGVCAICQKPDPNRALSVDHDHDTGEIRMLLCNNCNQGLGRFKDDPELMEQAAIYLRKFKNGQSVSGEER